MAAPDQPNTREELLDRHLEVFNRAVRSGDFAPLVALFAPDATLDFVGVPAGPFVGRDAIAAAYAVAPPDDTMVLLDRVVEPDGTVMEGFSWTADEGNRSGEMRLRLAGDRIRSLTVVFD